MPMLWLYILFAVVGAFLVLKMLGNERQSRRTLMEYEHQCKLCQELIELKRRGML